MRRFSSPDEGESAEWMNTYADMVTLLLTFFILLYSMSAVDQDKWQKLVKAFARTGSEVDQVVLVPEGTGDGMGTNQGEEYLGEPTDVDIENTMPEDFDQLYYFLKKYIEENAMEGNVELTRKDNSVFIRFNDNIFFNPDNYILKSESLPMLAFMGDCFKSIEDQILVIMINGHTADVNIPNYPVSDRRLSSQRADSVAIYFEDDKQIPGPKIVSRGYGNNFPIASNDTKEGQSKNRRVDITIVSNKDNLSDVDDLYNLIIGSVEIDDLLDKREPIESVLPKQSDKVDVASNQNVMPQ